VGRIWLFNWNRYAPQAQIAVDITEDMFEIEFNTALQTGTMIEERHTWPGYSLYRGIRPLQLSKDRIISIDAVTPHHDVGCAFADIEVTDSSDSGRGAY